MYSDYMVIWRELMMNDERKNIYNQQIGNLPELLTRKWRRDEW